MAERMIERCGVTGPESLWLAAGYTNLGSDSMQAWSGWTKTEDLDALIYEGRRVTGADDWRALSWAVAEAARRSEARTSATAEARNAEGLKELAHALGTASDQTVLDRVLSRLSERTQYAVRQQLKGSEIAGR